MFGYILTGLICFVLGIVVWYQHDKNIISVKQEHDQAIQAENHKLAIQNEDLYRESKKLENNIHQLQLDEQQYRGRLKGLDESLIKAEENAKGAAERFYNEALLNAQEKLEQALERESCNYQKAVDDFEAELAEIKAESALQFSQEMQIKQKQLDQATQALKICRQKWLPQSKLPRDKKKWKVSRISIVSSYLILTWKKSKNCAQLNLI